MSRAARTRWAISFADLSLLLLGFFVLLQASEATRDDALAGLNSYFSVQRAPHQADLDAAAIFEPGEALLSDAGRRKLIADAHPLLVGKSAIRIQSIGLAAGEHRFDSWDLSAARLGAVARALAATGVAPDRIRIAGLAEQDQSGETTKRGQIIRLLEVQLTQE